jgi:Carboxypeptidase regulatory-like domain
VLPRHTYIPALRRIASSLAALALVGLGVGLGASVANADPTYSIGGTVSDTTGAGIDSLGIVLDDSSNNPVGSTSTDSNGNYALPGLNPGSYVLLTSASTGYVATHSAVTITSGDVVLNLSTARVGSITGTVTAGGTGLSGVRVAAFNSASGDEYDADAPTDASGSYSITLPATTGAYSLYFANSGGNRLAVTSYDFGAGSSGGNGACRLDSGSANVAPLASGTAIGLTVVLNPDPAACSTATPAPAGTPAHHSSLLAQTGAAPVAAPTPTATPIPTETSKAPATTTFTAPTELKPLLTPTDSTRNMPGWGWLLVVAAVLAMLGGVGFTVIRHR